MIKLLEEEFAQSMYSQAHCWNELITVHSSLSFSPGLQNRPRQAASNQTHRFVETSEYLAEARKISAKDAEEI